MNENREIVINDLKYWDNEKILCFIDDIVENFNRWGNRQNANKLGKTLSISPINKLTANKINKM